MRSFNKVWIPSENRLCKFNEITHQQEKIIIKSIAQRGDMYASFMYALSAIMQQNSIDKKKFNTLDRFFYGLYSRVYCFGDKIDYNFSCTQCKKNIKYGLNLAGIVSDIEFLSKGFTEIIDYDQWKIKLLVPDIYKDIELREIIESNVHDYENIEMFNLLKFIGEITLSNNIVNFAELNFMQMLEFINNMSVYDSNLLVQEIKKFQQRIYAPEKEFLLNVKCVCGTPLLQYDFSEESLDAFLVMIYNDNLDTLYHKELNYYVLFPGNDINFLPPVERDIMISLKNNINQHAATSDPSPNGSAIDLAQV